MAEVKIAVLVGSLRKGSHNKALAHALEKLAGGKARFEHVEIGDLPLYNQDFDKDYPARTAPPPAASTCKKASISSSCKSSAPPWPASSTACRTTRTPSLGP